MTIVAINLDLKLLLSLIVLPKTHTKSHTPGSRKFAQSFVCTGYKAFLAKTNKRQADAVLRTASMSCKKNPTWTSSIWLRFVKIFSLENATGESAAFLSILKWTFVRTWEFMIFLGKMSNLRRCDCSKTSKALKQFLWTLTSRTHLDCLALKELPDQARTRLEDDRSCD